MLKNKKPLIVIVLMSFILFGLIYFLISKNKTVSEKSPTAQLISANPLGHDISGV